jgi:hypothetical protein
MQGAIFRKAGHVLSSFSTLWQFDWPSGVYKNGKAERENFIFFLLPSLSTLHLYIYLKLGYT